MKYFVTIATATALLAGTAFAQDATTRGGAESNMPSTRQNSPNTGASTQNPGMSQSGPSTINNAPVNSPAQRADQAKQSEGTGDSTKTVPNRSSMERQGGPATINNAPVGSAAQTEDQAKQAPRTGDSSKTIPTYR